MNGEEGSISPDRADRPLVLALDIGSSSVRVAVHDVQGRAVEGHAVRIPYGWDVGTDGSVRLSHQALLDLVDRALDELAGRLGPLAADLVAGAVSCFFHSLVALDDAGRPLTSVLSWADTTSRSDAAALRSRMDPCSVHLATGAPIHSSYWPARIIRLRSEQSEIRGWAGFPDLLALALTGQMRMSRSMASGTGLLDRARGTWSDSMLDELEIDSSQLPSLVGDEEPLGLMGRTASGRWPSLSHLIWFAPWGDGACGNVGLGAATPERVALMVGTSSALRAIVADPAPAIPDGLFAYRLGAGALVGGQLSEGGGLLAWASRLVGRSPTWLERAAMALEPDAHGLTVLPYTFGERGLGYHDEATASLVGLTPGTDAASVYRAIVESIGYSLADVDGRLSGVLRGSPEIVASGGTIESSPLMAQVLADAIGRDVSIAPGLEASRRGAALLALHGLGRITDLATVPGPPTRTVRFDPDRSARYRAGRDRQRDLYEMILGRLPARPRVAGMALESPAKYAASAPLPGARP